MGNLLAIGLEGLISKSIVKKAVKTKILVSRPELRNNITDKVITKSLIFISGYIKCLRYNGIQPINTIEIESLLIEESCDWIVNYVENGGK